MTAPITVSMPLALTPEMIRAVREHPTTAAADMDEWHSRLGWLICAYDVLIEARPGAPRAPGNAMPPAREY